MSMKTGEFQTSQEILLLGKPGVPTTDPLDFSNRIPPALHATPPGGLTKREADEQIERELLAEIERSPPLDLLGRKRTETLKARFDRLKAERAISKDPTKNSVTVLKDHTLDYPDLWMEIWVEGAQFEQVAFAQMFARAHCRKAPSPDKADLVVFTGGTDVDPVLYGDVPHYKTDTPDKARDEREMKLYLECVESGTPMLGVCRGAQFLQAMNGGKLFQHVDEHNGAHSMYDIRNKKWIDRVSSVHHQMVRENVEGGMEIIATSNVARNRHYYDPTIKDGDYKFVNKMGTMADIEVFFYRDTCSIGVQGHPEYSGYNYYTKWCLDLLYDLIVTNPDVVCADRNYRLKEKALAKKALKSITVDADVIEAVEAVEAEAVVKAAAAKAKKPRKSRAKKVVGVVSDVPLPPEMYIENAYDGVNVGTAGPKPKENG